MEANGYNIQVMEMWPDPPSIWKDLTEWALQENITRTAFNNLLQKISKHDIPVPLDSRTLLKLPRAVEVITKCDGEYIYLGVESGVTRLISKFPDSFQKRDIKRFKCRWDISFFFFQRTNVAYFVLRHEI